MLIVLQGSCVDSLCIFMSSNMWALIENVSMEMTLW